MAYLTEAEIPVYCKNVPGITMADVEVASAFIDAYKGMSFTAKDYKEQSKLTKKRGKLKHTPRSKISSVTSVVPGPFGGQQTLTYEVESLFFTEDTSPYYEFFPKYSMNNPFPTVVPLVLIVEYRAGYEPTAYPEKLKIVTGLLCENLKKSGGTLNWVERSDYDMRVRLSEAGYFDDNLKILIDSIPLT